MPQPIFTTDDSWEAKLSRIDERTLSMSRHLMCMDKRLSILEQRDHKPIYDEITSLKITQEKIAAKSALDDEKIKRVIAINSMKISSVITIGLLVANYLLGHFRGFLIK